MRGANGWFCTVIQAIWLEVVLCQSCTKSQNRMGVNKWDSGLWRQVENQHDVGESAFGKKKHAIHLFYFCSYSLKTVKASENTNILFSWP